MIFTGSRPWSILALVAATALTHQAIAQYLTMDLAGPNEGLSNPSRNIYQSHNQKVVENDNGIFCTFNGVKLDRSTDGGQTFTHVYNRNLDVDTYRAPTIETDESNNIYLIYPEPDYSRTRFQKFTSANGYTSPTISVTHSQATSDAKFASFYDQPRQQFYHATQGGYLFTFDKSGNFVRGLQVWTTGSTGARPQYPLLFVDDTGVIHFAETTARVGTSGDHYDSIRYLKSTDGGLTWKKMDGTTVSTPVSCDRDSSNSTQINLEDEEADTSNLWLANLHVKNGKVHFQYNARNLSPARQHYMRFDRATGVREIDSYTDFAGGAWKGSSLTINSISGNFQSDPTNPNGPLFATGTQQITSGRIVTLVSYDNGSTWEDWAQSLNVVQADDVGGGRYSPQYGRVIGTMTTGMAPWGWATPFFYQTKAYNAVTWDSPSSTGWGTAASWLGDVTPTFDNKVDVHFYAAGTTSRNNNLGSSDRTVRSINFNANADAAVTIYLSSDNTDTGTGRTLTLNTDGNGAAGSSAAINVHSSAIGSFTLGSGLGSITLADNLLVTHNGSGTLTIARSINETGGAKSLTKTGTGEMALAGANTFTGGIVINDGKLALSSTDSDHNEPAVNVAGGTLSIGSAFVGGTATIGNLTGSGSVDPVWGSTAGTRTIRINQTSDGTFSGDFNDGSSSRVLAVKKIGAARLTLSGTTSTYSGGTEIYDGLLRVSGDGSLGASGGNITFSSGGSGILMNSDSVVTLNSGRQINLTGDGRIEAGWLKGITLAGKITGTGALRVVSDANPGFVILSNSGNDYTGVTEVQTSSKLQLGASNVLPDTTSVYSAGTMDLNGKSDAIKSLFLYNGAAFSGTGTLTLSNAGGTGISVTTGAGDMTIAWNLVLGSQAATNNNLDLGCQTAGDTLTLNGVVSSPAGYGMDIWPATSTVVFGKANTYPGLTQIWGTLRLGIANGINFGNDVSLSGGTLDLNGYAQTLNSLTGTGGVTTGGGALTVGSGNSSCTFGGVISEAGSLTKTGTGALTLSGANTYTGGTLVSAGSLFMGSTNCMPSGYNITNSATFGTAGYNLNIGAGKIYLAGGNLYDGNSGSGCTVTAGGIVLLADSQISPARAGFVINSVISGSHALTQNRSGGTLQLKQACTYTGGTTITLGTLQLGVANAVPGNTYAGDVTVNGTLDLNTYSESLNGLNGSGAVDTVAGGTPTLTVGANGNSGTFSGVIKNTAGTLALTKAGAGTLTLSGANTYTGGTTITAGSINLGADNCLPVSGDVTVTSSGVLYLAGHNQTIRHLSLAGTGNGQYSLGQNIGATNTLTCTDITLNDDNVVLATKNANDLVTLHGVISGSHPLSIIGYAAGGRLAFDSVNQYTGTTTINSPVALQLNVANAIKSGDDVVVNGTLDLNGNKQTLDSVTGSGSITTGGGALTIGSASSTFTFSGTISENGSLTMSGSGTVTLSGANTYTGPTTISNGTLLVTGSLGNTAVTVLNGATLGGTGTIGGAVTVQSGGTLAPGNSIGTLTISNTLTLAGTTLMEVNAASGLCDRVQGLTSISYGGALVVTNLSGTLTNGQSFQLFSVTGSKTGTFSSITPALTGGKAWSFNPTNGVLSVVSPTAAYSTNISFSFSSGTLSLTWPATHLGWVAQSNAVSIGNPNDWFDIPGSSNGTSLNIIPNAILPNVFYRLRSP